MSEYAKKPVERSSPLVSICIPVLNGAKLIARAIESSVNQTYRDIEVLVVDNASTDDTENVVSDLASKDNRIRYTRNRVNIGLTSNFIKSFHLAGGEYVQVLAHDDWLSKNYVEEGVRCFKLNPGTAAVLARVLTLEEKAGHGLTFNDEVVFRSRNYSSAHLLKNLYKSQWGVISIHAMMRKRDVMEAYPHPLAPEPWIVDFTLLARLLTKFEYVTFTNKSAYVKLSRSANHEAQERSKAIQNLIEHYSAFRKGLEGVYSGDLNRHRFDLRRHVGTAVMGAVIVSSLKEVIRGNSLALKHIDFNTFFRDYSWQEKIMVFASLFPSLFGRLPRETRRLFKRTFFKWQTRI